MARQKASDKEITTTEPVQTGELVPNLKIRNQQVIHHHLFKALLSKMKKNISWKRGQPDIREVEHVHFFHSVNSWAMPQEYTNEVGGHFHKITWDYDANGTPIAKCGPSLKKISVRGRDGRPVSKIIPVEWPNILKEHDDDPDMIVDAHLHEMSYEGSDVIQSAALKEIANQQAKLMRAKADSMPKTTEAEMTDSDR